MKHNNRKGAILLATLALATTSSAQQAAPTATAKTESASNPWLTPAMAQVQPMASQSLMEQFWSNDVSNCADWVFGNGSLEAGQPWTDIDINFFCSTEGPAGFYNQWAGGTGDGSAAPAINSTTADNGFLMVDSDLFGADANYSASWVENCWVQTAQPIDCSAHPFVSIAFQTRYRCWDNGSSDGSEKCFVEVSRDGVTWPTLTNGYTTTWANEGLVDYGDGPVQCRYDVFPEAETGFETDNPSFVEFDITEAAGGQGQVWIRFRWVGTWGYSWEIDDIEVYDTPENDTRIDNYLSFSNYFQSGMYEYGAWAQSQIPANLAAGAKVYNVGYADQTNVVLNLEVNGMAIGAPSGLGVLPAMTADTLVIPYQPAEVGVQTLNYEVSADAADENPANNSATQSFEVTDLQYGRDNGVITEAFPTDGTDDFVAMPVYEFYNPATIYGIDVAILEGSEPGTPIRAFLVDMNDPDALSWQYGGEFLSSDELDLAAGYANAGEGEIVWYTLTFDPPYAAMPGDRIGAAFEHYGGNNVQIGEAQFTYDQTAFVYGPFGSGSAYDWYYTNNVPMVRLNLDPNAQSPALEGCTDISACNFNPQASVSDGSCEYLSCAGCMDSTACNYDPSATLNSEDCSFACYGCTDSGAFNYNPSAWIDDGSCVYFEPSCAFLGNESWEAFSPGVHAAEPLSHLFGLDVDQEVVFHVPATLIDPVTQTPYAIYAWSGLEVSGMPGGLTFVDFPESGSAGTQTCVSYAGVPVEVGVFDVAVTGDMSINLFGMPYSLGAYTATFAVEIMPNSEGILGCTYALATNFLPYATVDNGTCVFAGCTNPLASNYQLFATEDDGSCNLEPCTTDCPADLDGDGATGTGDLLLMLSSFGVICPN